MKYKRSKRSGMSTMEMAVSGAILTGMIVLSFETMVTGAKLSAQSVKKEEVTSEGRTAAATLEQDIKLADASLKNYSYGESIKSDEKELVLRIPKFDVNGAVVPGNYTIVGYKLKKAADPKFGDQLIRWTADYSTSSNKAPFKNPQILASNVKKLDFCYYSDQTIAKSGIGFPLPGPITLDKPEGKEIRIIKASAPWAGVNLLNLDVNGTPLALTLTQLLSSGMTLVGNTVVKTGLIPSNETLDLCL